MWSSELMHCLVLYVGTCYNMQSLICQRTTNITLLKTPICISNVSTLVLLCILKILAVSCLIIQCFQCEVFLLLTSEPGNRNKLDLNFRN
jgi:hypothetical protein